MDFDLGAGLGLGGTGTEPVYTILSAGVEHQAGDFTFSWLLTGDTAGQFPAPFLGDYYGSFYRRHRHRVGDVYRDSLVCPPGQDAIA